MTAGPDGGGLTGAERAEGQHRAFSALLWFNEWQVERFLAKRILAARSTAPDTEAIAAALESAADDLPTMAGWNDAERDTIRLAQKRLRDRAAAVREGPGGER